MSHAASAMGRRWSFSIGSVKGTAVRIHATFLLLLAWVGVTGWLDAGPAAAVHIVTLLVLVFFCVVLHEFGHIFAARRFGVKTPEVVLLPIGGVSRLERIPDEPRAEFVIAIAGPLVTLAIALGLLLVLGRMPTAEEIEKGQGLQGLVAQLAYVNLALFLFNLIPAFPMDGGRVLRAGLAAWLGHTKGTRVAAGIGQACAMFLGIMGIMSGNIILVLVAVFVYFAAGSENGIVALRDITAGKPARDSMIDNFVRLHSTDPVAAAASALVHTDQRDFPVVDRNGHLAGFLNRDGIIRALASTGQDIAIANVMLEIPQVSQWTRMDDIVPMLAGGAPAVGVADDDGRCLGYITWENLMEELLISRAMHSRASAASLGRPQAGH
ncbi:site-2 protease family protein [Novosphingobium album (ex Hu et al. 2023)]|uniref:Zinc metalloprotease n=1 Tax=Novosphingobium album (ex Hu et al. 2023) TaxID=2930093 RepID=A0ABT0AYD9_9SPHN|nr:site-2 protease family protein [Novosphingobium album (ex Hu et al. 2023)]MCJ2177818.1 site-2 protease family protein [Novosphingobium album (ex Hu et al. 2023)]